MLLLSATKLFQPSYSISDKNRLFDIAQKQPLLD